MCLVAVKMNALVSFQLLLFLLFVRRAHSYWRMDCPGVLFEGRLDPLVAPGRVSGHSHVVLGGNGFSPVMDYASTQRSTCTTCTIEGDNSNYWIPSLYFQDKSGSLFRVPIDGGTVYYQQRAYHPHNKMQPFRQGFRMTAGNPTRRVYNGSESQKAMSHRCLNYDGEEPVEEAPRLPPVKCPNGIRSQVYFPSCWNGKDLDTTDHQSHMAYPSEYNSGRCPNSHPFPLISIFYEFVYQTQHFAQKWDGNKQPFVYSNGDDTGYGIHGDFINGWHMSTLERGIEQKITQDPSCAGDPLCGGIFRYPEIYGQECKLPPLIDEEIDGPIKQLPGCNQIRDEPLDMKCNTTGTIKVVNRKIYTDVAASLHYRYIGCGLDRNQMALDGLFRDQQNMTVERCVTECRDHGFIWAGLEYSSQCFCGNRLATFAMPKDNMIGSCVMSCAGDKFQHCGAGGRLSLYRACQQGRPCENAKYRLVGA